MVVDTLRRWLAEYDPNLTRRYKVAYSGGMDSSVLLHALVALRDSVMALELECLHVDHGLRVESAYWADFCKRICAKSGIPFHSHRLDEIDTRGKGREAAARDARYLWFAGLIDEHDVLVTAHHRDDQAETMLFNLFRGSGVGGLAAMPAERRFAGGVLARPLLPLSRDLLASYAAECGLSWIDDPSNQSLDFDRNYIRHCVIPAITTRWPALSRNAYRASVNFAEALQILDRVANEQIARISLANVLNPVSDAPVLDVSRLAALPLEDFLNISRVWIHNAGWGVPPRRRLLSLRDDLVLDVDRVSGSFSLAGADIRRYRKALYLVPTLPPRLDAPVTWQIDHPIEFDAVGLSLKACASQDGGLDTRLLAGRELSVDFVTTDRKIRTHAGSPRKSLRKIFQEAGIPPWMRRVLPRINLGTDLLCVPGVAENVDYLAPVGGTGITFQWSREMKGRP